MSEPEGGLIIEQLLSVLDEAMCGASGLTTYFVDNRPDCGLLGSLAGLGAADAARCVLGTPIAAHVHHVAFAMDASAYWIGGGREPRDWSASWRVAVGDDEAWAMLVEHLRHEYQKLRAAIKSGAVVGEGAMGEAVGAIAHIAYHLGSVRQKLAALSQSQGTETA
jgi:hypothetical protein